jgi:hypothetical protein
VWAQSVACARADVRVDRRGSFSMHVLPESFDRWRGGAQVALARLQVARGEVQACGER